MPLGIIIPLTPPGQLRFPLPTSHSHITRLPARNKSHSFTLELPAAAAAAASPLQVQPSFSFSQ